MKKDKREISIVRSSAAEYLTFVASTGADEKSIEMRYEDENIWLTQKMMAALYDVDVRTINDHIKKIYSVDIWNGFHNEIIRDTYKLNDKNEAEKEKDGTKEYYKLLEKFDNLLEDYTLTTDDGEEVKVGEKRIFAPDFIYVENGVAKRITSATSENQKDADAKLTKEILKDEEKSFDNFFKNK